MLLSPPTRVKAVALVPAAASTTSVPVVLSTELPSRLTSRIVEPVAAPVIRTSARLAPRLTSTPSRLLTVLPMNAPVTLSVSPVALSRISMRPLLLNVSSAASTAAPLVERTVPLLLNTSVPAPNRLVPMASNVPALFTMSALSVRSMRPRIVPAAVVATVVAPPFALIAKPEPETTRPRTVTVPVVAE